MEKKQGRIFPVCTDGRTIEPVVYHVHSLLDNKERIVQLESESIRYYGQKATQTVGSNITDYINYEKKLM